MKTPALVLLLLLSAAVIDMTLHVIARMFGEPQAERLANETEYEWHRDPSRDPFANLPDAKRKKKP
jgi:transcriptional regulator GlxA family with amidase domain